jgi:fumarate reductase flavoprotein subunit
VDSQVIKGTAGLQADVVVIGGGGAGMAAAITAMEKGCTSVIVLEKAKSPGGSTALAHDIFGIESPVQERAWFDTSKDDMFKFHMEWTHWTVDPRIVRAFIDKSGDTIRWLEEMGQRFELRMMYPNQSPWVRHALLGRGVELCKLLRKNTEDRGARLLTGTRATKILLDEHGQVSGVVAESKDGEVSIQAKTVIITTGGYGNNRELLRRYYPHYKETITYDGPRSNTGDGLALATDVGADLVGLGSMNMHGPSALPTSGADLLAIDDSYDVRGNPLKVAIMAMCLEPDTIWVNKNGRRYVNECFLLQFFAYGHIVARQPEGLSYTIYDSALVREKEARGIHYQEAPGWAPPDTWICHIPLPGLERELRKPHDGVKIADTWEELADWMGVDRAALKATVDEYNAACDSAHDSVFGKERKYLRPLRTPPYYALIGQAHICDTIGGIKIDEKMRVISTAEAPVPGLYAAGVTTGGWEAETYDYHLTGHLVGFALNSGRIAGESAVEYLAR